MINPQSTPIKNQGMGFKTKILIAIVIILVLGVGIVVGMMLVSKEPVANNTTNNTTINETTVTVDNSNSGTTKNKNTTTSNNNDEIMISATDAMYIATETLCGYDLHGAGAYLSERDGHPIWVVNLENPDGSDAGQCKVDATTGEFLG